MFQQLMDDILREVRFAFTYLDDKFTIISSTDEHMYNLTQFKQLNHIGIIINLIKNEFLGTHRAPLLYRRKFNYWDLPHWLR